MTTSILRRIARILPLSFLALGSCTEPLVVDGGDSAQWMLDWTANVDTKCVPSSDREVAARTRIVGKTTYRVVRPGGDERAEVPIQDVETGVPTSNVTIHGNCDVDAHDSPVVVSQPRATTPWTVTGKVITYPGVDSIRFEIRGRFDPPVARFTMKDAGATVVETPIVEPEQSFTVTIPYSAVTVTVDRFVGAAGGPVGYAFNLRVRPLGP